MDFSLGTGPVQTRYLLTGLMTILSPAPLKLSASLRCAHTQKKQKQTPPLKPQTYCAITYAAADMAGARAAGVSSVSIHAW